MALSSVYTDLLIPDDVKRDALNSFSIDVTSTTAQSGLGASYKDVCIQAIRDVTGAIESYLNRTIIVQNETIYPEDNDWMYSEGQEKWVLFPEVYPVIEVDTSTVSIRNDYLIADSQINLVDVYYGWKRTEQTLEDLQSPFPNLATLPSDMPNSIRRVAQNLVMYEMNRAIKGNFDISSKTTQNGSTQATITESSKDVYKNELAKIEVHRRIAA
ncbi:MAG: hypothetical protein RIE52_11915 [Balneola sp.]